MAHVTKGATCSIVESWARAVEFYQAMRFQKSTNAAQTASLAFTLAEVMIAVFIVGIVGLSLYAGFTASFSVVKLARENLRATQIMMQRMETIRLYTWTQVTNNSYVIPAFVDLYDPLGKTNQTSGAVYVGFISNSVPDPTMVPPTYRTNMRAITVSIYWTNYTGTNKIVHSRQMQTYVARYGMQNYIYGSP